MQSESSSFMKFVVGVSAANHALTALQFPNCRVEISHHDVGYTIKVIEGLIHSDQESANIYLNGSRTVLHKSGDSFDWFLGPVVISLSNLELHSFTSELKNYQPLTNLVAGNNSVN